ncbi:MAG: hypothetical protein WC441_00095 [Patescibacteria group bacterium]
MEGKSSYEWFLKPLDADTNKAICRFLLDKGCLEENIMQSMPDGDGRNIQVIRVRDYSDVGYLRESAKSLNLKFKIYNRAGNRGPIRECSFFNKKKNLQAKP